MDWLVEPLTGFKSASLVEAADTCSGGGTLFSCSSKGSLVFCDCGSGLILKK